MMEAITQLTHALTGKDTLQECSEAELRKMVRLYPFFGPAQLLLARKAKEDQQEEAKEVEANAALFVPNALWFERLMSQQVEETIAPNNSSSIHETVLEAPATTEEVIEQPATATQEYKEEISTVVFPEETVMETPATTEEVIEQVSDLSTEYEEETGGVILSEETAINEPAVEEEEIVSSYESPSPAIEVPNETDQAFEPVQEESFTEEPAAVENTFQLPVEEEQDLGEDFTVSQSESTTVEDIVKEKMPELEGLPPIPSFKIEPLEPGKMELSFEPYHTVDYFASQGIRFRDEEKPKDRLSLQLKSFTEWLKTLKKAPEAEMSAGPTRQEEKKVEQMARVSINDPAVVTEAMAEVWEKQGNTIKAIELYKKLSLLDPDKNAYFASKIEHLKQL